jgi:LacI family transcriptional regulator
VVTIKDVARVAGVHPATASRALNPALVGRISAETTARVEQAAAELGYVADPFGRSLRTQRSGTVGVLVPDLLNPFYPPLLRGIERGLRSGGFEALIASTDNDPSREPELIDVFRGRRCEGYLVATATSDDPAIAALVATGTPVVLVNRLAGVDAPAVVSDDGTGIRQALDHLTALGHRRIAHVAGPAELSVAAGREAIYRTLVPEPIVARAAQMTAEAGRDACRELLARGDVTAILAANDMVAVGCYAALDDAGLRCPADVSLVGINDMPLAGWLRPPLTTVALPQERMGEVAAELIRERIADPDAPARTVTLPTELRVRGSTSEQRVDLGA